MTNWRQKFVDLTVPQANFLGLTLPDPKTALDNPNSSMNSGRSTGASSIKFYKGNGPCNAERIAARRNAHAAGAWVREAASAYAAKQRRPAASARLKADWEVSMEDKRQWPLYEVFIRARGGLDHTTRRQFARGRCKHGRRSRSRFVHAPPGRSQHLGGALQCHRCLRSHRDRSLFEPARDKIYRHPTFYEIPDEVKTL